ncbi:MAG TPA: hypothetical protein VF077_12615 [Nitrospiraceae bacterium]
MSDQTMIIDVQIGASEGKVGWVLGYADGRQESFVVPLEVARQFFQGLETVILALEQQASGTQDGVGMGEHVTVRLV